MLTELDDPDTDPDIAVRIEPYDAGGTKTWHPQRDGHLLLDADPAASTHLAHTLADTLSGHSPHVWIITGPSRTPTFLITADADTAPDPVDVMDFVWRFTTQRKTLIDNGQATTRDFTPAYLVIDSLEDVVDTLRLTCLRSLQLLSVLAHRGHRANVYLAAITDLTAPRICEDLWRDLETTAR
ncbi:hypothetical protein CH275_09650 [Rhodococcus sp. 06-235-1A]|uniref:hypothetical protein n=1 Tax=Rhodococcus sp. 06-235-1A TaxID=2022508 RepID=UPI000B9A74CC|nr:hypothetical protein [Rhodococcus sp. 06-235-1A]OZD06474.1 hypothetical protein CH275_09650 [Rhodococcus sp. 06-235-1A]